MEIAFIVVAFLLGFAAAAVRLPPLVGYLIAGMLLGGPGSVQIVRSEHDIEAIAELGVALLLFSPAAARAAGPGSGGVPVGSPPSSLLRL